MLLVVLFEQFLKSLTNSKLLLAHSLAMMYITVICRVMRQINHVWLTDSFAIYDEMLLKWQKLSEFFPLFFNSLQCCWHIFSHLSHMCLEMTVLIVFYLHLYTVKIYLHTYLSDLDILSFIKFKNSASKVDCT